MRENLSARKFLRIRYHPPLTLVLWIYRRHICVLQRMSMSNVHLRFITLLTYIEGAWGAVVGDLGSRLLVTTVVTLPPPLVLWVYRVRVDFMEGMSVDPIVLYSHGHLSCVSMWLLVVWKKIWMEEYRKELFSELVHPWPCTLFYLNLATTLSL